MKKLLIIGAVVLFVAVICLSMIRLGNKRPAQKHPQSKSGFAVVELFTSEGCSSCPPADEAVANLLASYSANVYVLGFHVDYWNNLGWKDAYSSAGYSQRQQKYGSILHLSSIYTPQAIVNGST